MPHLSFWGSLFRFLLSVSPSHPFLSFSHSQKKTHFLSMLLSSLIYSGGERRGSAMVTWRRAISLHRQLILEHRHVRYPFSLPSFGPHSPPLLSPQQSTSHYVAETVCSVVWILSTISHRRRHTYSKKRGYRTPFLIENVWICYIV